MTHKLRGMFGKGRDKKQQKLGIDIPRIVNKFMTSDAGGYVDKTEYNYFWLAMKDDAPDVDVYIHLLVQHLLGFMSKNNQHRIPFNAQVLLNTINFLVLRHPTESPSKQVREILGKWFKNRVKYNDQALPAAKDVLGVLYKQRVEQKNGLDSLIIQCYQFYSHDELSRIADYYKHPTILHVVGGIEKIGRSSGDKVCIWPYLKDLASRDPDNFRLVIQNTITKLRSISGQILLLPKLAEISLLALIFMMRQLISYTRVPDEQWLDKSISNLKRFYLWPVPYGSQARDLLIKLQKERVAPGYALIQKIWRECRLPEIILNLPDALSVDYGSRSETYDPLDGNEEATESASFRPLYYLFDVDDAKALLFANVMKIDAQTDWGSSYKVHSGPSAYISALLILNISGHPLTDYRVELPQLHHTGIGCDLKKKEFPSPGQMASNEMLYPSNEVLSKLTQLLKNLHELTSEDEKITLRFMIAGGNSILSATASAYASLIRYAQPLLSNFNIEFFILPYSKNHYSEWLARQDPWYNRHIYLPLECRLFVAPSLLPDTKSKLRSHGHLHTVGRFYRQMSESYAREADQLVSLRLWECLCWEAPPYTKTPHQLIPFCQRVELGKNVDKKGQNEMYQFGYNAQVFRNRANTAYNNMVAQEYKNGYDDYGGVDYGDDPQSILNQMQQQQNGSDFNNFSERSLGAQSSNRADTMYDDPTEASDAFEAFDAYDYQPIALDIEWQPVDMLGRPQMAAIEQKSQYLDGASISSVPRYGDKGFPASPDKSGVIHLYCKVRDTTKKKKFQEYALLKAEPSQHVRSATIATSAAHTQNNKNNENNKFYIMVDDQIYGKFSRIKIQPMMDPISKEQVCMPIRTFFPVNTV
eukprot:541971_1